MAQYPSRCRCVKCLNPREEDLFSHKNRTYFIFSKSGYTQEAQKFAQEQQLHLITFQQMVQDLKKNKIKTAN